MKNLLFIISIASTSVVYASDYYIEPEPIKQPVQYKTIQYTKPCVKKPKPLAVYTGRTITITQHYDIYRPVITYKKIGSYSVQKQKNCGCHKYHKVNYI